VAAEGPIDVDAFLRRMVDVLLSIKDDAESQPHNEEDERDDNARR